MMLFVKRASAADKVEMEEWRASYQEIADLQDEDILHTYSVKMTPGDYGLTETAIYNTPEMGELNGTVAYKESGAFCRCSYCGKITPLFEGETMKCIYCWKE